MNPLLILLIAMIVVIGSVLALRLHAFLALIFGAMVVAALSSPSQVLRNEVDSMAVEVVRTETPGTLTLKTGKGRSPKRGLNYAVRADDSIDAEAGIDIGPAAKIEGSRKLVLVELTDPSDLTKLAVGDRLIHHTQLASARRTSGALFVQRMVAGFGSTAGKIGILIAMAAIIGKCLLDSGAAERIVIAARNLFGEKRTPFAFLGSGFVLGVPVFFDTVFYLLLPLGKAMRLKTGKHYVLFVLTIVAGATMAHSLVPPTPGPLLVAEELNVDIGLMMLAGIGVGLFAVAGGYAYAKWADARWDIPLRPSAELSQEELDAMAGRDASTLPPLWISLLPILLPVVLIAGGTVFKSLYDGVDKPGWYGATQVLGDKNLALVLAAAVALGLLAKRIGRAALGKSAQTALASGGVIILITAAGGAFGHVLRQTNIADAITALAPSGGLDRMWLLVAFLVTALIRIAQGSATVAMITAVGIIAPIASGMELSYHPVYLALAIGSGSKPIPWMNDSGFWIISKMSGFTEAETLKTASVMMSLMGVIGLIACLLGSLIFPMV